MTKFLKMLFLALLIICNVATFAQGPGDDTDDEDLEDFDELLPAPIDENLLWLTVSGISLACYVLLQKQKNAVKR